MIELGDEIEHEGHGRVRKYVSCNCEQCQKEGEE